TWPSLEDQWLDGWLLRAGGGVTRRSNSASVVDADGPAVDLDERIDEIEDWFRARRLPPIFRLTVLADPAVDARLDERGYRRELGAIIMTREVGVPPQSPPLVDLAESPSEGWLELMAREPGRGGEHRPVLERMLRRIELPRRYARIDADGETAAIGLGVLDSEHLAVFMMQTSAELRRGGLGKRIAESLIEWAIGEGAQQVFLQVHPANHGALGFYRALGFQPRYEYWYRQ
ncbi:MAG: GNAT family N-acetyltransferase, partial [Acidimicrobiia bacterium]